MCYLWREDTDKREEMMTKITIRMSKKSYGITLSTTYLKYIININL